MGNSFAQHAKLFRSQQRLVQSLIIASVLVGCFQSTYAGGVKSAVPINAVPSTLRSESPAGSHDAGSHDASAVPIAESENSTANATNAGSHDGASIAEEFAEEESNAHGPEIAMLFLFISLLMGCLTRFGLEIIKSRWGLRIPYSVILLTVGGMWGALAWNRIVQSEGGNTTEIATISMTMWTHMNPRLILFIFLPALIFGSGPRAISCLTCARSGCQKVACDLLLSYRFFARRCRARTSAM